MNRLGVFISEEHHFDDVIGLLTRRHIGWRMHGGPDASTARPGSRAGIRAYQGITRVVLGRGVPDKAVNSSPVESQKSTRGSGQRAYRYHKEDEMQETIMLQAKPSLAPIVFLWVVSNGVFLILAFMMVMILGNNIFIALFFIIFMLVVVASTVRLVADLVSREFTKYTLTNERMIKEAGILRRVVNEIPIDAIQGVNLQSPLLGQLLDYGSLIVPSAGMVVRFWDLPHAQQWKQTIQDLSKERLIAGAASRLVPRVTN